MFRSAALSTLAFIAFSTCAVAQIGQRDPFGQSIPNMPTAGNHQRMATRDSFNSLNGTVRTSDDKPMKDVRVELHAVEGGGTVGAAYTSATGTFEFSHIPQGSYEVVATSGLEEVRERVEVSGMGNMVNLRMPVSTVATDGNGNNTISIAQYKVPDKARDELKKAREASTKQKLDDAQKHIARALEIYPKYSDAYTLRGILKLEGQDMDGAIADLHEAIQYDGNSAMAYLVMGAALNTQGKFDEAIRSLERGEALSPNSWQAYFEMGKALVGKKDYDAALRQLNKAQALTPSEYPIIHLVKAHAMLALNSYSDAMNELQAYLEKEPNGPNSQQAHKMLDQAKAFAANHPGK